jgi:hypothetical protein
MQGWDFRCLGALAEISNELELAFKLEQLVINFCSRGLRNEQEAGMMTLKEFLDSWSKFLLERLASGMLEVYEFSTKADESHQSLAWSIVYFIQFVGNRIGMLKNGPADYFSEWLSRSEGEEFEKVCKILER